MTTLDRLIEQEKHKDYSAWDAWWPNHNRENYGRCDAFLAGRESMRNESSDTVKRLCELVNEAKEYIKDEVKCAQPPELHKLYSAWLSKLEQLEKGND